MRSLAAASLLPLLFVMACGDEAAPVSVPTTPGTNEPAQPGPADETPAETPAITWEKCSLVTGETDGRAQCADVEVPLDWNAPEGKKVTFFVKRVLGNAKGPKQQLWLLQGGPGGAGDGLESIAEEIAARDDTVDIYIPDHRGTGRSAYLDCPATRKNSGYDFDYAACAKEATNIWGADGLATFTTTTAARDVGYVIEKSREKDQKVHVYGVSYGTYWAQRYLQLFPNQPTAVTLDSVCQSGICSLSKMGYWFDLVAKKYLGECAQDAFCADKMGPDPVAKVKEAITKADAGTCSGIEGIDGAMLRQLYQWFITSVELRVMIPSTAYRIVRCNDDDVDALQTFVSNLQKMFGGGQFAGFATHDLSSDVLGIHIALSELEEAPPPTAAQLGELMKDSVIAEPDTHMIDAYQIWPRYPHDQWVDKYPESSVPVLLMNGTLDPQTPLEFAEQIAPHYTKPHQIFVQFPRAAHGTIHQSQIEGENPGSPACGMLVWKDFVANPNADPWQGCTANIRGLHFEDGLGVAQWMYGRPSLWGLAPKVGAPNGPPPLSFKASKAIENEIRRAERDSRVLRLGDRLRLNAR